MGGQAFLSHSPPLPTPRMPLTIYKLVLLQTLNTLRKHYTHVESPIEAPGKETYGDVDILVAGASPAFSIAITNLEDVGANLMNLLSAKAFITTKGSSTILLAIPWPTSLILDENPSPKSEDEDKLGKFVQIDIRHLANEQEFNWELFHTAHGDLWSMLGSTIRRFGLTVNNTGMHLRISEIELLERKNSYVFLTSSPCLVLEFLGLDEQKWWKQFNSREEVFEYAASCRLFWVKPEIVDGEAEGDVVGELEIGDNSGIGKIEVQEGSERKKRKLKHKDRRRTSARPVFKEWFEEFIPKCRRSGRYTQAGINREQLHDEAFAKFGVREEYESKLKEWQLIRNKQQVLQEIKAGVPDSDLALRSLALKVLRGIIIDGKDFKGIMIPDCVRKNDEGLWDINCVKDFVVKNWEVAATIAPRLERERVAKKEAAGEKSE